MYDISELKVGDIMVCGCRPYIQLFYIHNIDLMNNTITSSGISESMRRSYFKKSKIWVFDRKANDDEVLLFYDLISMKGLKFDLNKGIYG